MNTQFLQELVPSALLALDLAEKEPAHLAYTHRTLFEQEIDLQWVIALPAHGEELSEKIDAFVGRFSRLQDHIGEKLIPRFSKCSANHDDPCSTHLHSPNEWAGCKNVEEFFGARKLRYLLVHEYMAEPEQFFEAMKAAENATPRLMGSSNNSQDTFSLWEKVGMRGLKSII